MSKILHTADGTIVQYNRPVIQKNRESDILQMGAHVQWKFGRRRLI